MPQVTNYNVRQSISAPPEVNGEIQVNTSNTITEMTFEQIQSLCHDIQER
jgi:hypothetical protein